MRWIRFCLSVLLAVLAQCLVVPAAHAKWLRAETRNFVIYSSGSERELRRFASNLEMFDGLAQRRFGLEPNDNTNKLTIYFLDSQSDVSRLAGDKDRMVAGFYSARLEGSFAVANRSRGDGMWDLNGMTVLFHEYAHHFMFRNFDFAYPAWYVEGFAEYLSTATFSADGSWTMGKPAFHRAYSLLEGKKLPIEKLLFSSVSDLKSDEVSVFYGRAWLLVHMLNMKPEHQGKLKTYFTAIREGKPPREAAALAFGDLQQLDKSLDLYLRQRLSYYTSPTPIPADTTTTVTELDEATGQLVGFRMLRLVGRMEPKAMAALRGLAAANLGSAEIWHELALAERQFSGPGDDNEAARQAREKAAEAAVDRALAADPNHVRANVLKADILMTRLEEGRVTEPARWSDARKFLITANKYAVDDPLVLFNWYNSFRLQGREPSATARAALARAFVLAPEVINVRVAYAFDLADQRRFDEALGLVEFLAQHPHHAAEGRELVERIKEMRDRAAADKDS